ncbi:MAG: MarR family transcriptional regulator [Lachnospiraceae bacterium]|nr:MarR family transcriptional regulator [Lachnospiraceae bacterium]
MQPKTQKPFDAKTCQGASSYLYRFPLYACSRKIVNAYTPYLKPLGLTYTQYLVFMVLWEKKEASVGELGSTLSLDAGTLSPLLKKLEPKGNRAIICTAL